MIRVSEALNIFMKELNPRVLEGERIPLKHALRRVLAVDFKADADLPPFDRSTVDGYAVRAEDTYSASEIEPIRLTITKDRISAGKARRVWTGAPLPSGANAVVMLEYAREAHDHVEVYKPIAPGDNISRRGEVARKGEIVLRRGRVLRFDDVALLAAFGTTEVEVVRKPRVAILSVGSELVEVGHLPRRGAVFDSNRHMLRCLLEELGCVSIDLGVCPDDIGQIRERIAKGLKLADAVVTTGGVSVGASDFVPEAVEGLGKPGVVVHGIAMRPAKPTALAVIDGKAVVMLPGNPVAAFIAFEVFVRPLVSSFLGTDLSRPVVKARLTEAVASQIGVRSFLRVRVLERAGELSAQPIRITGASVLTTLTEADGYVEIPEDRASLEKGEVVEVELIGRIV